MSRKTPWGVSQGSERLKNGITYHTTAGHGGYLVPIKIVDKMPAHLRAIGLADYSGLGMWFEQDCACCAVAIAFPSLFTEEEQEAAKGILRNYYPATYEHHYNVVLQPGESQRRDEEVFYALHKEDWLVNAAQHSTAHPEMVECWARKGVIPYWVSERRTAETLRLEEKQFLVPVEEYRQRGNFPFVIDLSRHNELLGAVGA